MIPRAAPAVLLLLALVSAVRSGGAQERVTADPAAAAPVLTLGEALSVTADRSPEVLRARSAVRAASAGRLEAWGRILPSLTASSTFDLIRTRRFTTTGVFGDPTEREEAVEATTRGATQGLSLQATLFDGGAAVAAIRAADARLDRSEIEVALRWSQVRAEVVRAYFDALEKQESIRIERDLLAARRQDVEVVEMLFRVAATDRIDLLAARIDARRQEARLEAAEVEGHAAALELARVMGRGGGPIEATLTAPFEPFDPDSMDVGALFRSILEDHPRIRSAEAELEASRSEAGAESWFSYLPRIDASVSYLRSEFGGSGTGFFNLDPRDSAWGFGLRLALPLFDRFDRRIGRARATAKARDAEESLRAARLAVEAELRTRLLDLRSAHRQLAAERAVAGMAREGALLAREKFRIGAIDFARLHQVADQATLARRAHLQRRFDFYRALAALERAAGRPLVLPSVATP